MEENTKLIADFLNNDSFVQWVLFGKNQAEWQEYLIRNPSQSAVMEEARQLVLEIHEAEGQTSPALNQAQVWSHIRSHLQEKQKVRRPLWRQPLWRRPALRWAASLILVLGAGWLVWSQTTSRDTYQDLVLAVESKSPLFERVNEQSSPLKVTLDDGSVITLEKNSRLSFPAHFDKGQRTVVLTGEAFFEVAKDPNRPFLIYANEIVTKVLGTSFRIKAFEEDKEVIVQVRTGRVSVYSQQHLNLADPETTGLVVHPNQEAIYSRKTDHLSRKLTGVPVPVATSLPKAFPVRYDEVAVSKVLSDLEKRYGIRIIYNEEVLDYCYITTTLSDESLYDQLDLVCKTIGATYKEVDAHLIIESQGCK